MAITLADLMQEVRETCGIQTNAIVSDQGELPRIVNQAVSAAFDTVVRAYAPYFAERADFSVDATGVKSLVDIVNPAQPPINLVNGMSITTFDSDPSFGLAVAGPLLPIPAYYQITSFKIAPTAPCDTGITTFELLVNGVATGDVLSVPNLSSSVQINTSVQPALNANDTLTMKVIASHSGGWGAVVTVVAVPVLNKPSFYKELGVDYNSQGSPLSVPRLDSFLQRNQNGSAISDVSGAYTLWYVPSCPVLDDVYDLPSEMERFRTMILLEASIMVYLKRQMDTSQFEMRLMKKTAEIMASLRNRVNEPRMIPLRGRNGGCGRAFDIIGSNVQLFRSSGYTGDYFWSVR